MEGIVSPRDATGFPIRKRTPRLDRDESDAHCGPLCTSLDEVCMQDKQNAGRLSGPHRYAKRVHRDRAPMESERGRVKMTKVHRILLCAPGSQLESPEPSGSLLAQKAAVLGSVGDIGCVEVMEGTGSRTGPRTCPLRGSVGSHVRITTLDARVEPFLDLGYEPHDPILAEPDPLREPPDRLEPCDMRTAVRNATDCLQLLL